MNQALVTKRNVFVLFAFIGLSLTGISFYGQNVVEDRLNSLVKEYKLENKVTYDHVLFNPITFTPTINDLVFKYGKTSSIKLSALVIRNHELDKQSGTIDFDISYDLDSMPLQDAPKQVKELLLLPAMLGLSQLSSTGRISLKINDGDMHLRVLTGIQNVTDLELDFEGKYGKHLFQKTVTQFNQRGIFAFLGLNRTLMNTLSLVKFKTSIDSDTFMKKSIRYQMKQANLTEQHLSKKIAKVIDEIGLAKANTDEMTDITDEVIDFLNSPGELYFSVSPNEPVSVRDYIGYLQQKNAFKRLNMDISG